MTSRRRIKLELTTAEAKALLEALYSADRGWILENLTDYIYDELRSVKAEHE